MTNCLSRMTGVRGRLLGASGKDRNTQNGGNLSTRVSHNLLLLIIMTMAVLAAIICITDSKAYAAWGPNNECYRNTEETHHCYAISEWYMEGTEKVTGGVVGTSAGTESVPGAGSGDFSDEELWVLFRGYAGWVETGQTVGYPYSSGEVHPFVADTKLDGSEYWEYVTPQTVSLHEYHDYWLADGWHNGSWCAYWLYESYNSTLLEHPIHCVTNFPIESQFLQAGMESGTSTEPETDGEDFVEAGWPPSNETWHSWKKATYFYQSKATCYHINTPESQWLGSITYGAGKSVCGF